VLSGRCNCVLFPSKKNNNYNKCSVFASSGLLHLHSLQILLFLLTRAQKYFLPQGVRHFTYATGGQEWRRDSQRLLCRHFSDTLSNLSSVYRRGRTTPGWHMKERFEWKLCTIERRTPWTWRDPTMQRLWGDPRMQRLWGEAPVARKELWAEGMNIWVKRESLVKGHAKELGGRD